MNSELSFNNLCTCINFMIHRQAHDNFEVETNLVNSHNLIWLYHGTGTFQCDEKTFTVPQNSIIYYPPHTYQKIKTIDRHPLMYYSVKFKAAIISESDDCDKIYLQNGFDFPFYIVVNEDSNANDIHKKIEKLHRIYLTNQASSKKIFYEPFFLVEILKLTADIENNEYLPSDKKRLVDIAIGYMESHFNQEIALEQLCEITNVSNTYLNNLFKKVTGTTPIDYLINLRVSKSKTFLENGYSVQDVASMCGFSDMYHFSHMFKKKEHMSPTEYKKINS